MTSRSKEMKKTKATWIILFLFRCIPLWLRKKFFIALSQILYHVLPKRRLITLHNLRSAYPEKDIKEIIQIARGVYRHIGIVAAEFFELPYITKDNLHEWVEFEGLEHFYEAFSKKKGVLPLVAHFGNWELMTVAFPLVAEPLHIIYRPLDNLILNDLTCYVRTLNGNVLIEKEGSMMKTLGLLRQNKVMGILSDQNMAVREGVFVDFFGRPACTAVGTAFFAMHTGAPVLPTFMPRVENGKYRFMIKPPVEIVNTGNEEADRIANTQRFASVVEEIVRQFPDQWSWMHHRWKTKLCQKE